MLIRLPSAGVLALLLAGLLPLAGPLALPGRAEPETPRSNEQNRPPGLTVLQDKVTHRGREVVGIYGAVAEPGPGRMWRVQVWEELDDRVTVATDKIGCSVTSPMRITGTARRLVIRELNPGGLITPANRLDHLMWWAVCVPAEAGRDPATLGSVALKLGYSGTLPEREQVLVQPGR
jgi:hypothetical protein